MNSPVRAQQSGAAYKIIQKPVLPSGSVHACLVARNARTIFGSEIVLHMLMQRHVSRLR